MATFARQINLDFPPEFETGSYLDPNRWGSFSVLSRKRGSSRARQSSYRMYQLPEILKLVTADDTHDYWITQAIFRMFNRRKVNLASIGTAFVDLDFYRFPHLIDQDPERILDLVLERCGHANIPEPSIVIDSGKGLQIKWFHEALPKKVLPRWEIMQRHLVTLFEDLGGDHHSRDVSRVLRVVHTYNQKTMNRVEVLWVNNRFEIDEPVKYVFNDLISQVIPEPKTRKKAVSKKDAVKPLKPHKTLFTTDSLNWMRLCDLQKLIEIRGGDVGEGLREPMAFYLCNFYGLRYHKDLATRPVDDWAEFRQLCLQSAPYWSAQKIREKTSNIYRLTRDMASGQTVEFRGREYPPLYTPKNDTLINTFQITDAELKQLDTIISSREKQRRHTERERQRRQKQGAESREQYEKTAQNKKKQAMEMKEKGMKNKEIAQILSVHVKSVSRLLREGNRSMRLSGDSDQDQKKVTSPCS